MNWLLIVLVGAALGALCAMWQEGYKFPRAKRRSGDALNYSDMTPEQKREYGIHPVKKMPSSWQDLFKGEK